MQDSDMMGRIKESAMKNVSEEGTMTPILLLKIQGREQMICTAPDMSTQETKSNTIDLIKRMIASGVLEEFVMVCEASRREKDGGSESQDCILIMHSSRSREVLHMCDIVRGESISFGDWSECSDARYFGQGSFNNLFDRVACSNN